MNQCAELQQLREQIAEQVKNTYEMTDEQFANHQRLIGQAEDLEDTLAADLEQVLGYAKEYPIPSPEIDPLDALIDDFRAAVQEAFPDPEKRESHLECWGNSEFSFTSLPTRLLMSITSDEDRNRVPRLLDHLQAVIKEELELAKHYYPVSISTVRDADELARLVGRLAAELEGAYELDPDDD